MDNVKKCAKCKSYKLVSEFYKFKDGKSSYCVQCHKQYVNDRYYENKNINDTTTWAGIKKNYGHLIEQSKSNNNFKNLIKWEI